MGWRVEGQIPNVPKLVIIAAPHTSNWDFVVGIATKLALGLRVLWLGKDSLFRAPLGPIMRALGGMPVDRHSSHDVVKAVVDEFERRDRMMLGIAPEGTRKRVERWRTGFYHIAHGAKAPILPVALNWGERAIQIGSPFVTTGNIDADMALLQDRFASVRGRRPKS
jgi:1-acyl-sn-glycerol-3-phosphate acyltransferase